jgi:hypothetical protein
VAIRSADSGVIGAVVVACAADGPVTVAVGSAGGLLAGPVPGRAGAQAPHCSSYHGL